VRFDRLCEPEELKEAGKSSGAAGKNDPGQNCGWGCRCWVDYCAAVGILCDRGEFLWSEVSNEKQYLPE